MNAFFHLTKSYLIETLRSPTALFWSLAFPLVFVVGFPYLFSGGQSERIAYIIPGVLTINLIAASFFGISLNMVTQREKGLFRQFRVTPLKKHTIISANAAHAFIVTTLSLIVQLVVAMLLFGIRIHGSWTGLILACLFGMWAFIPLGLWVGSTARDTKTAPAITNLLFFPFMFLSGAAFPLFLMPAFFQKLAYWIPATYVLELIQGAMVRTFSIRDSLGAIGILVATGAIAFILNALFFRWESQQKINLKHLVLALLALILLYGGAFLLKPQLYSLVQPG